MNLRPSGYEPDELPGCSTPRQTYSSRKPVFRDVSLSSCDTRRLTDWNVVHCSGGIVLFTDVTHISFVQLFILTCMPGNDLLSRGLSQSTIGAEGFHIRVRDGIACRPLAITTRQTRQNKKFKTLTLSGNE